MSSPADSGLSPTLPVSATNIDLIERLQLPSDSFYPADHMVTSFDVASDYLARVPFRFGAHPRTPNGSYLGPSLGSYPSLLRSWMFTATDTQTGVTVFGGGDANSNSQSGRGVINGGGTDNSNSQSGRGVINGGGAAKNATASPAEASPTSGVAPPTATAMSGSSQFGNSHTRQQSFREQSLRQQFGASFESDASGQVGASSLSGASDTSLSFGRNTQVGVTSFGDATKNHSVTRSGAASRSGGRHTRNSGLRNSSGWRHCLSAGVPRTLLSGLSIAAPQLDYLDSSLTQYLSLLRSWSTLRKSSIAALQLDS